MILRGVQGGCHWKSVDRAAIAAEPRRIFVVDEDHVVCGLMIVNALCLGMAGRGGKGRGALSANDGDLLVTDYSGSRSAGRASARHIRVMSCIDSPQSLKGTMPRAARA